MAFEKEEVENLDEEKISEAIELFKCDRFSVMRCNPRFRSAMKEKMIKMGFKPMGLAVICSDGDILQMCKLSREDPF